MPATSKRLFHLEMMLDANLLHDVLALTNGRARIINMGIAKTGGVDENGEVIAMPSTREFIMAYIAAQSGKQFAVLDVKREAREHGLNVNSIGQQVVGLANEGVIKRIATGIYQEKKSPSTSRRNGHAVTGAGADVVLKLVAAGGDIHVTKIMEAFKAAKMSPKSVTNLMTKMIKSGQITRGAKRGLYRAGV